MSRYLIFAMHDVMPVNWPACRVLLPALNKMVRVPKSLFVIPNFYHDPAAHQSEYFCCVVSERLAEGGEPVLRDYAHLDDRPPGGLIDQLVHTHYTAGEGEFSVIPLAVACTCIQVGAAWFVANSWSLYGFVAPTWLINPVIQGALNGLPLCYTATLQRFYLLHPRRPSEVPCLTYNVRSPARRLVSHYYLRWFVQQYTEALLLRLGLHPVDTAHLDIIRHWQELFATCLETRVPVTKNGFAQALAQAWMGGLETTIVGQA